jgi:hypothetical protein
VAKKGAAGHPINLITNSNSRPKLEQIITPRATLKRVFSEQKPSVEDLHFIRVFSEVKQREILNSNEVGKAGEG